MSKKRSEKKIKSINYWGVVALCAWVLCFAEHHESPAIAIFLTVIAMLAGGWLYVSTI